MAVKYVKMKFLKIGFRYFSSWLNVRKFQVAMMLHCCENWEQTHNFGFFFWRPMIKMEMEPVHVNSAI